MPEETPHVWGAKFGERTVQFQSLPMATLVKIANDASVGGIEWSLIEVVGAPQSRNMAVLEPLIRACAEWVGEVTLPDPFTFETAMEYLEWMPDDLPEPVEVKGDPPTGPAT